nr:acyl-CoA dehydrogenase family protein [Rhodococcus opacus]
MTKAGQRLSSGEPGQRQVAWAQLADLGLVRLTGDPARGGSGAGWAEAAVLLESAAVNDVDLPLVEHDLLVGWLADRLSLEGLEEITSISIVGPDGRARNTAWTQGTELALVVCSDPAGGTRVAYAETDQIEHISHGLLRPHHADIRVDLDTLDWTAAPTSIVEELRLRGALARAVQMIGAIGWVVDSAIAHVNERRQFGQPLARFQAVRGLLASMAADAALATAAVASAVEAAAQGDIGADPTRVAAVAVAKSCTGHASEIVVRNGHQLHGAIGTTLEHCLHRHSTALLSWRNDYGSASYWDRRLAEDAKTRPHGSLWDVISSN